MYSFTGRFGLGLGLGWAYIKNFKLINNDKKGGS